MAPLSLSVSTCMKTHVCARMCAHSLEGTVPVIIWYQVLGLSKFQSHTVRMERMHDC